MFIDETGIYIYSFKGITSGKEDIVVSFDRYSFHTGEESNKRGICIHTNTVKITTVKSAFGIEDSDEIVKYIESNLVNFVSTAFKASSEKIYSVCETQLECLYADDMQSALSIIGYYGNSGKISIVHKEGYIDGVYNMETKLIKGTGIVSDTNIAVAIEDLRKLISFAKMNITVHEWELLEGSTDLEKILTHCTNNGV